MVDWGVRQNINPWSRPSQINLAWGKGRRAPPFLRPAEVNGYAAIFIAWNKISYILLDDHKVLPGIAIGDIGNIFWVLKWFRNLT